MGLNYRKWSLWPPILSNVGTILNEIYVSGRLKLNDLDEVTVENPINDQVLVYDNSVTQWKNENIGNILPPSPPTSLLDEIRMFGGDVNTVFPGGVGSGDYDGWYLCNGQITPNGSTLDLQSRFVVGYDNNGYSTIGQTGGEKRVTLNDLESALVAHHHDKGDLSTEEKGSHTHTVNYDDGGTTGPDYPKWGNAGSVHTGSPVNSNGAHTHTITGITGTYGQTTAAQSHENRPPYIVVAFIQFKGN